MAYTLNIYSDVHLLYLSKTGKKAEYQRSRICTHTHKTIETLQKIFSSLRLSIAVYMHERNHFRTKDRIGGKQYAEQLLEMTQSWE